MHPDALKQKLTVAQLRDWSDFYAAEPWSANSIEHALAIQTAVLAQPNAKQGVRMKPKDFLPFSTPDKKIDMDSLIN